ncbi:MAG: redoxin domain-containing protein [Pseudomonadota bacterium]
MKLANLRWNNMPRYTRRTVALVLAFLGIGAYTSHESSPPPAAAVADAGGTQARLREPVAAPVLPTAVGAAATDAAMASATAAATAAQSVQDESGLSTEPTPNEPPPTAVTEGVAAAGSTEPAGEAIATQDSASDAIEKEATAAPTDDEPLATATDAVVSAPAASTETATLEQAAAGPAPKARTEEIVPKARTEEIVPEARTEETAPEALPEDIAPQSHTGTPTATNEPTAQASVTGSALADMGIESPADIEAVAADPLQHALGEAVEAAVEAAEPVSAAAPGADGTEATAVVDAAAAAADEKLAQPTGDAATAEALAIPKAPATTAPTALATADDVQEEAVAVSEEPVQANQQDPVEGPTDAAAGTLAGGPGDAGILAAVAAAVAADREARAAGDAVESAPAPQSAINAEPKEETSEDPAPVSSATASQAGQPTAADGDDAGEVATVEPATSSAETIAPVNSPTSADAPSLTSGGAPEALLELTERYPNRLLMLVFWSQESEANNPAFDWLNTMHARYDARGLEILAVNRADEPRSAESFAVKQGAQFDLIYDRDGTLHGALWVRGAPATFLLNEDGDLLGARTGHDNNIVGTYEDEIRRLLRDLRARG